MKLIRYSFYIISLIVYVYVVITLYHMRISIHDLYDNLYYDFPKRTTNIET